MVTFGEEWGLGLAERFGTHILVDVVVIRSCPLLDGGGDAIASLLRAKCQSDAEKSTARQYETLAHTNGSSLVFT